MAEARTARRDRPASRSGARWIWIGLVLLGCRGERGAAGASDSAVAGGAVDSLSAHSVAAVPVAPAVPAADSASSPAAVEAFLRHADAKWPADSIGVVRGYAAEGLRLLASGIEELAARDTLAAASLRPRLSTLRVRADSLQREPDSLARARLSSEAFVLASDLLQTLQEGVPPALTDRAAEARQAAADVRPDQPLGAQEPAVRRFFQRAAAALRGLIGARPA